VKQSKLDRGNGEVKHKTEDERKTKVQLIDELTEMRQQIVELEARAKQIYPVMDESTREFIAISNQLKHNLAECVKELRCLYGIAAIAEKSEIALDELYQEVANLLPSSWQYPEICCARITTEDKEFRTANYRDTKWKLCSDIKVGGVKAGAVEVNYLEERPALDEGSFSRDERRLLDAVAEQMGRITECKRAEEKLVRLSSAVKMSTDSIVIGNLDGKIIDVNEATLKMYGTDDKRDLIGKNSFDLIAPEELEKALAGTKEVLEKGYVTSREYHIITKDGGTIPVEMSVAIMKDADGKPIGSVGISRDITERKKAEEALKETNMRYKLLFESSEAGINLLDKYGNFLMLNKPASEPWGMSVENIVNKNIRDIMPPDMANEAMSLIHEIEETGTGRGQERYIKQIDKYFIEDVRPVLGSKGKFFGVQVLTYDITEHKKAEKRLQESEEKLRVMFGSITDGVIVTDLTGTVVEANDGAAHLVGYSNKEELIGRNAFEFVSPKDRTLAVNATKKTLEEGLVQERTEYTILAAGGREIDTDSSAAVLYDSSGNPTGIINVVRDITERKKAEEALKESEEKLRSLLENIPDFVITLDRNHKILMINRGIPGIVTAEQAIGTELFNYVEPTQHEIVRECLEKVFQIGMPERYEVRGMGPEGPDTAWYETRVSPNKLDGQIISVTLISRDITERKRAEEEITRLSQALAMTATAITLVGPDGKVMDVNEAMLRLHGFADKQSVLGKPVLDLLAPEQREAAAADMQDLWQKGEVHGEYEIITEDGKTIPVETSVTVMKNTDGKAIGLVAITRDITERKEAEEKLKESEEKFRTFVDTASDLLNITDIAGNITDVNESMARVLGYSKEELIGMHFTQILPLKTFERDFKPPFEKFIKRGGEIAFDTAFTTKDGKEVYGELRSVAIHDKRGRYVGSRAVFHDLTERKKAEQELQEKNEQLKAQREELVRKATELELVSQAKSEFLASMSHELRTPLSAVIGFSELMLDGIPGEINDEQRGCLNDILDSGRRLLSLINDILDLSKVEAGKIELKPQNLDIANIVSDVVQIIKPVLNKNRQEIEVSVTQGLPEVRGDKNRLEQILLNLLSNASKFTEQGGRMRVHVRRKDDYCQVAVIDTGIGIKKEDQEHVFEAFVQGETLSDRKKEGTGLGLTLTKRFVEAIGGRIWMESEYGKGSTFIFTIPLAGEPLETSLGDRQSSYS